ncbi:unnamed protein product [Linum tenue]|uniref:Uncharacterized protein n=1 Tax=Linum tenue TaxID=586396 RepID=A0AAV0LCR6_9ROSI|nr:unnamed protein product [Linum tenue]
MERRLHPLQLQRHARRLLHLPLPLLQHRPPRRLRPPRLPLQPRRRRGGDLRLPEADAATGRDGGVGGDVPLPDEQRPDVDECRADERGDLHERLPVRGVGGGQGGVRPCRGGEEVHQQCACVG